MDVDFPRGGILKNEKVAQRSKRKYARDENKEDIAKKKFVKSQYDLVWTNRLTSEVADVNLLALGCVKYCTDSEIRLELVDGFTAIVPATSISDLLLEHLKRLASDESRVKNNFHLARLFKVGQLLAVKVISAKTPLSGSKKIKNNRVLLATIEPKEVNSNLFLTKLKIGQVVSACIKSVEDKGFYMDLGSKTFGFLPFNRCSIAASEAVIGQVLLCTIAECTNAEKRLVKLTADTHCFISHISTKEQLMPGSVVNGLVKKVTPKGIYAKFGDHVIGFVSKSRLQHRFDKTENFAVNSQISCVVTYVRPNSNAIGFSCQSHLFDLENLHRTSLINRIKVGDKISGKVKLVTNKNDVYFVVDDDVSATDQALLVFVPANQLHCENNAEKIRQKYVVDSQHKLRVTGISLFNQLVFATNKKDRLNQPVISLESAVPGTLINAVIDKVANYGMFVKVSGNLTGFISPMHAADIPVTDMESKFSPGQDLKARILYVDIERKRLALTMKKSLLTSKLTIVSRYDTTFVDTVTDGTVVHLTPGGILVCFYDNVKGFLRRSELEAAGIVESPDQCFFIGQVVRVRILSVDVENRKMTLAPSLLVPLERNRNSSENDAELTVEFSDNFKTFNSKVIGVTDKGLNISFGTDNKSNGFIPSYHLTDSATDWDLLSSTFQIGDIVGPCIVFSKGTAVTVSAKPALIEAARTKTIPSSFDQIEQGNLLVGVIGKIHTDLGYFVDFPGGILHALAPRSQIDESESSFVVGQTVIGRVDHVNSEKRRFRVSLKLNACLTEGTDLSISLLTQYLINRRKVIDHIAKSNDPVLKLLANDIKIGQIVQCVVSKVTAVGLICTLSNGLKGVITADHLGVSLERFRENETIDALVIFVDFVDACLELSALPDILNRLKSLANKPAVSSERINQMISGKERHKAVVLVSKKDWILVLLGLKTTSVLAYMPARLHYNDIQECVRYQVGESIVVTAKSVVDGHVLVSCSQNEKIYNDRKVSLSADLKGFPSPTPMQKWVTVEIGKIYDGHVLHVTDFYVYIYINQSQRARIHASELKDSFDEGENPLQAMTPNRPVRVKVIGFVKCPDKVRAAECTSKKIKLECKSSKKNALYYKEKFNKGDKVFVFVDHFDRGTCYVEVTPHWKGFIKVAHLSNDSSILERPEDHFKKGQAFSAYVVSVQTKEKRLMLSVLNASDRAAADAKMLTGKNQAGDVKAKRKRTNSSISADSNDTKPTSKQPKLDSSNIELPRLKVDGGFNWSSGRFSMKNLMEISLKHKVNTSSDQTDFVESKNSNDDDHDDDDNDEADETEPATNLVAPSKDAAAKHVAKSKFETDKIEEEQLIQKELSLLDPDRKLGTPEDFDRLLMGSPDSSLLWLRYMAMYLQTAEISKARAVADRALKTISVREENERFNVWVAMMNMENMYGTKETLKDVFERAKQVNDQLNVYRQLLKIYQRSNKTQEADELVDEILKKFKAEYDVWILAGEHYYSISPKRPDLSRDLMKRSLKSLPENQQVDVVSRYAQMEFKYADAERGRTLFENLLNEYPKRADVWSVYIDMTTKHRNPEEARVLFERVTSLKLGNHKLKSFYKKWQDFEIRYGTDETRKQVAERAAPFVTDKNSAEAKVEVKSETFD